MSADRWNICPKCRKRTLKEYEELQNKVAKDYGKIPMKQWQDLVIKSTKPVEFEEILREDYWFDISEKGVFEASYKASCGKCGFKYGFKHKEDLMKEQKKEELKNKK